MSADRKICARFACAYNSWRYQRNHAADSCKGNVEIGQTNTSKCGYNELVSVADVVSSVATQ